MIRLIISLLLCLLLGLAAAESPPHTDDEVTARLALYTPALRVPLQGLYDTLRLQGWPVADAWEGILLAHLDAGRFQQKIQEMQQRLVPPSREEAP